MDSFDWSNGIRLPSLRYQTEFKRQPVMWRALCICPLSKVARSASNGDVVKSEPVEASTAAAAAAPGRVVQLKPMKSKLKAPGTERFNLKHDKLLSSLAFN